MFPSGTLNVTVSLAFSGTLVKAKITLCPAVTSTSSAPKLIDVAGKVVTLIVNDLVIPLSDDTYKVVSPSPLAVTT